MHTQQIVCMRSEQVHTKDVNMDTHIHTQTHTQMVYCFTIIAFPYIHTDTIHSCNVIHVFPHTLTH